MLLYKLCCVHVSVRSLALFAIAASAMDLDWGDFAADSGPVEAAAGVAAVPAVSAQPTARDDWMATGSSAPTDTPDIE